MKKGLSGRPDSHHSIATELAWHSIPFLGSSCWRFSVHSQRFHGAHNACIVLSRRSHCADISKNALQSPCKCDGQPWHFYNDLFACTGSSYCVVTYLTARLWQPYGDPTVFLFEHRATAFVLCMLKVCAMVQLSMRSHSFIWNCHCIAAEMLAIVLCAPQLSAFFLDA